MPAPGPNIARSALLIVDMQNDFLESMMASMEFPGLDMAGLVHGVMQANLRAMQELSRVKTPQALAELQHRFASEYIAALQHGTMSLLKALSPAIIRGDR